MFHSFGRFRAALVQRLRALARPPPMARDPIDHPDIAVMSLTELADLPLTAVCGEPTERALASASQCPCMA